MRIPAWRSLGRGRLEKQRWRASSANDSPFPTITTWSDHSTLDARHLEYPESVLATLEGRVAIDEIQRRPELFEVLRYLIDRPASRARCLLLESASPSLIRGVSETLAGRIGIVDPGGFDLREVGADQWRRLWIRGGFPRSFRAASEEASVAWRDISSARFSNGTFRRWESRFVPNACDGSGR